MIRKTISHQNGTRVRTTLNRTALDRIVIIVGQSDRLPTFDIFTMPKHPNKHSIVFRGRKTSVSLEAPFWAALQKIAGERRQTISDTVAFIGEHRNSVNLSSAVRVFVLDYFFNATNVSNDKQGVATQSHGK